MEDSLINIEKQILILAEYISSLITTKTNLFVIYHYPCLDGAYSLYPVVEYYTNKTNQVLHFIKEIEKNIKKIISYIKTHDKFGVILDKLNELSQLVLSYYDNNKTKNSLPSKIIYLPNKANECISDSLNIIRDKIEFNRKSLKANLNNSVSGNTIKNKVIIIDKGMNDNDFKELEKFIDDCNLHTDINNKIITKTTITLVDHHDSTITGYESFISKIKSKSGVSVQDLNKTDMTVINNQDKKSYISFKSYLSRDNSESACSLSFNLFSFKIKRIIILINKRLSAINSILFYFNAFNKELIGDSKIMIDEIELISNMNLFDKDSEEIKLIIKHISDSDTGINQYDETEQFKSGLCSHFKPSTNKYHITNSDKVLELFSDLTFKYFYRIGEKSLRKIKQEAINDLQISKIRKMSINLNKEDINDQVSFLVLITTRPHLRNHCGLLMEKLSKRCMLSSIGAVAYATDNGKLKISLRKRILSKNDIQKNSQDLDDQLNNSLKLNCDDKKEKIINLSEICALYGGGGHMNAASFTINNNLFNTLTEDFKVKFQKEDLEY